MITAGVALISAGAASWLLGLGGRLLERRWAQYDPGDRSLGMAGQSQLARQKAFIREAPFWRIAGLAMAAIGCALLVVGQLAGS